MYLQAIKGFQVKFFGTILLFIIEVETTFLIGFLKFTAFIIICSLRKRSDLFKV